MASWEWRPSRQPNFAELSNLPASVDGAVGAYPMRAVIGRLLSRGPLGTGDGVVVALYDGSMFTYSGYVGAPDDQRAAVDERIAALSTGGHRGAVIAAVGHSYRGQLALVPAGLAGQLCGIVFDLVLSPTVYTFRSPLIALEGQYLMHELRVAAVAPASLDPSLPGYLVVAAIRSYSAGRWPAE